MSRQKELKRRRSKIPPAVPPELTRGPARQAPLPPPKISVVLTYDPALKLTSVTPVQPAEIDASLLVEGLGVLRDSLLQRMGAQQVLAQVQAQQKPPNPPPEAAAKEATA